MGQQLELVTLPAKMHLIGDQGPKHNCFPDLILTKRQYGFNSF
jgi:hypothetical protein